MTSSNDVWDEWFDDTHPPEIKTNPFDTEVDLDFESFDDPESY